MREITCLLTIETAPLSKKKSYLSYAYVSKTNY